MENFYSWIFISIAFTAFILFILGTKGLKMELIVFILWNTIITSLSINSFFTDTKSLPPRMLLVIAPSICFVLMCYRKKQEIVLRKDLHLALHSLRLPVELMLHLLFLRGLLPREMTYQGWNFDILTGLSAIVLLLIAAFGKRTPKKTFYYWNLFGMIMLAIVVSIAILSAPSPIQILSKEQPNLAILQFPYILLPSLIVPLVLTSHLLLLKQNR